MIGHVARMGRDENFVQNFGSKEETTRKTGVNARIISTWIVRKSSMKLVSLQISNKSNWDT
jgi:hypothetical protein